jgi:peptidoglycan hydrolase-like protein with peptidoglycan-binding domain
MSRQPAGDWPPEGRARRGSRVWRQPSSRRLAAAAALLALLGSSFFYLLKEDRSAALAPIPMTAVARRGTLTETVDARFTMVRNNPTILRASASGVVTRVRITPGMTLAALRRLVGIGGQYVYGIPSSLPFYRDLKEGDKGDDVAALQRALVAAGYHPRRTDGAWTTETTAAFKAFQHDQGLDQSGRLTLGQFVSFPPGAIVLEPPVSVGARVARGSALAIVGKTTDLLAQAEVSQLDFPRLKAGEPAQLTFDALPGSSVAATVAALPTKAEQGPASAGSSRPVIYAVRLAPKQLPDGIQAGMTGEVRVTIGEQPNAVLVPTSAINGSTASPTVQVVVTEHQIQTRPVTVGFTTATDTQILDGVKSGETVVIGVAASRANSDSREQDGSQPPGPGTMVR